MKLFRLGLCLLLASAAPAIAQDPLTVVAVPQFSTPKNVPTSGDDTGVIARQVADVIASDLRSTHQVMTLDADRTRVYSYPETTAPLFRLWRNTGAKVLVTGFVQERPDGRVTVGCYLHDIAAGRELGRQGFAIDPAEWRRAAHRCADMVYSKITGHSGGFESLVAYVAESGSGANRVKRIALMDGDGTTHRFLTAGDSTVLTPSLSPDGSKIAYVGFSGGRPQARIVDVSSSDDRALVANSLMSFAPRFSPDGSRVAFSMAEGGNTDLYVTDVASGGVLRLTATPGVDTSPSYSPDGRKIVFESDRSGTSQLYVMNADGSDPRRISFGGARYGSPAWSPDGELIAFTRIGADGLRVGVMNANGSGERLITNGPFDEGPAWGAGSGSVMFQRPAGGGRTALYVVSTDGGEPRAMATPQGASDPDWSAGAAQ